MKYYGESETQATGVWASKSVIEMQAWVIECLEKVHITFHCNKLSVYFCETKYGLAICTGGRPPFFKLFGNMLFVVPWKTEYMLFQGRIMSLVFVQKTSGPVSWLMQCSIRMWSIWYLSFIAISGLRQNCRQLVQGNVQHNEIWNRSQYAGKLCGCMYWGSRAHVCG